MRGWFFLLNQKNSNLLFYFLILLVILLSFRFYSAPFFPALNSDHAVTILMLHSFHLPEDIYFWGQDRMGSIIPLLGQIPLSFGISALLSEAIVHYFILVLGFFSFASFLKSNSLKLLFALFWFLPPFRMVDVTQFAFGIHYSLLGIALFLIFYHKRRSLTFNHFQKIGLTMLIILVLIASIWASDMAIISVLVISGFLIYQAFQSKVNVLLKLEFWMMVLGVVGAYSFVTYAKSQASVQQTYSSFGNPSEILETVKIFVRSIIDFFLFNAGELFTSLFAFGVLISVLVVMNQGRFFLKDFLTKNPIAVILLLDTVLLLSAILVSKWTLLNGVPRRYFTCVYISTGVSIFVFADFLLQKKMNNMYLQFSFILTILFGAISGPYSMKYEWPKTLKPRVSTVRELESLGSIGIIGEYWNSYINSCTAPDQIKATPHEHSGAVRSYRIVDEVFHQDRIFLIKDLWMEKFPDSLSQFNRVLYRKGEPFYMGESYLCEYTMR